jgi:MFS transporter, PAT family, beta-lactamase induction signal transducer AmpG
LAIDVLRRRQSVDLKTSIRHMMSWVALRRVVVVAVLGFASGLPLALTGQALQAWLSTTGIDIATIGFLSLVGLPYTFKFLWAPLMDRFELPLLGRRRGWIVLTQLLLAACLLVLSTLSPSDSLRAFALLAVLIERTCCPRQSAGLVRR